MHATPAPGPNFPGLARTRRRFRAGLSQYLKKLTRSRRPTGHRWGIQRLTTPHAALRVEAVAGPGVACGTAMERHESVSTSASIHLTKKGAAMKLVSRVVVVVAALALSACGSVQSSGTDASGRGGGGIQRWRRRSSQGWNRGRARAGVAGRVEPAERTAGVAARAERAVRALAAAAPARPEQPEPAAAKCAPSRRSVAGRRNVRAA